jgi:hypothetical protein
MSLAVQRSAVSGGIFGGISSFKNEVLSPMPVVEAIDIAVF